MQNEVPHSSAYNFRFDGGATNDYAFQTKAGYVYLVSFKPSGYIFPQSAAFQNDVFEFVITLTNGQAGALPLADLLIEPTIVLIFQDFFVRRGVVVVYICDSSDQRQAIRHRMFNRWFLRYRHLGFVKLDAELNDPAGTIYTSVLLHRTYPHRVAVLDAFLQLTDEINEAK
jgi:hypothetical protein